MTQYYVGFDVNQNTTVAAVLDVKGKQIMNGPTPFLVMD